jgi:hypothetical protein
MTCSSSLQEVELYNSPAVLPISSATTTRFGGLMPYIPAVYDGFDQTSNFGDITRLFVPVSVGIHKARRSRWGPKDGRDEAVDQPLFPDAALSLASTVNQSVYTTAVNNATLVSKRTVAATGYDDLAAMGAIMTEQGHPERQSESLLFGPRLSLHGRHDRQARRPATARSAAPPTSAPMSRAVGNFDLFENDQNKIILAAATATGVTITNTQPLYYTPVASTLDSDGNTTNIDNRRQIISIAVTGSTVKVGDAFTIAGVNSVHHISKQIPASSRRSASPGSSRARAAPARSRSSLRSSPAAAAPVPSWNIRT